MVWQDTAITIIIVAFSYALLPQVIKGFKEKRGLISLQTSIITGTGMYILSGIYLTLGLYFSATIGVITGALWTTLFIQKIIYK